MQGAPKSERIVLNGGDPKKNQGAGQSGNLAHPGRESSRVLEYVAMAPPLADSPAAARNHSKTGSAIENQISRQRERVRALYELVLSSLTSCACA